MLGPTVKMSIGGFNINRPRDGSHSTAIFGGYASSRGSNDGDEADEKYSISAASSFLTSSSNSLQMHQLIMNTKGHISKKNISRVS